MTVKTQRPAEGVQKVLLSYSIMLVYGILITLIAFFSAWICNHFYPLSCMSVRFLEYIGYICWAATLGTLGPYDWRGNSFVEKIDRKLANILSLIGIFSFVMAKELVPL